MQQAQPAQDDPAASTPASTKQASTDNRAALSHADVNAHSCTYTHRASRLLIRTCQNAIQDTVRQCSKLLPQLWTSSCVADTEACRSEKNTTKCCEQSQCLECCNLPASMRQQAHPVGPSKNACQSLDCYAAPPDSASGVPALHTVCASLGPRALPGTCMHALRSHPARSASRASRVTSSSRPCVVPPGVGLLSTPRIAVGLGWTGWVAETIFSTGTS